MTGFPEHFGSHVRVEALKFRWIEARHREGWRRRQKHKVTSLECERPLPVDSQPTAALEHRAETWLAKGGIADTPAARASDSPRGYGAGLKEGDDVRERIIHVWTLTNESWTLRCRSSGQPPS